MAEILFRSVTNGPDAAHWKVGDIVTVQENGHTWGRLEAKSTWVAEGNNPADWPGGFFLIKLPNATVAQVSHLLEAFDGATAVQGNRRTWRVNVAALSQNHLNKLNASGELVVGVDLTEGQAKALLRHKQTNAAASW